MKPEIGERILRFRNEVRWSQGRFGAAIGVSQRLVSLWELGIAKPNAQRIADIAPRNAPGTRPKRPDMEPRRGKAILQWR